MTRRAAIAIAVSGIGFAAVLWWWHRLDDTSSTSKSRPTSSVENSPATVERDWGDQLLASQAPLSQRRQESPAVAPSAPPPPLPVERVVAPAVENAPKPPKATTAGFAHGLLPTSEHHRSAPAIHASSKLQEAYQARSSRAALLNRRLERHIQELRARTQSATAAERAALEHDLAILDAQLAARRPLESPEKPSR